MRVLGKCWDSYIAVEVIEARAFVNWRCRVIIKSKLNEYYVMHKDRSPLTEEQANSLVRDLATQEIIDLDSNNMGLFWEDDVVIPVKNETDPNGDIEPLMVQIAKAKVSDEDEDNDDDGDKKPEISGEDLIRAAERLGIKGHIFRNENGEPDTFYSPEEQHLMVEECLKEKGWVSEEELAEQLGIDVETLRKVCFREGIKPIIISAETEDNDIE